MKKLIKKIEDIMVAITFAEAGEFDEANRQAGNLTDQAENASLQGVIRKTALESVNK